jgi:hypothetical protein
MAKEVTPKGYEIEHHFFALLENEAVRLKFKSYHSSLHRYLIHLCNRHRWKNPIDVHTPEAMQGAGIGDHRTYKVALEDLEAWGLIVWLYRSRNQWTANKVHLVFGGEVPSELEQGYENALVNLPKHPRSTPEAQQKHPRSTPVYTKQSKQQNTINTQNSQNTEEGEITIELVVTYFVEQGWSEAAARAYFDTYSPHWYYKEQPIKNWRAFAAKFVTTFAPPTDRKGFSNRGTDIPKGFFSSQKNKI